MSTFGKRLADLIKESGKSQTAIAEAVGVHQTAISSYVCERGYPNFNVFVKLADCFEVTLDYLSGRTDLRDATNITDEMKRERDLLNYEIVRKRKAISMINGILERI